MLDLVYLDEDEPWSPGDLKIFYSLQSDNKRFLKAVEELSEWMKQHQMTLSAWSVNLTVGNPNRYKADWYVSLYSPLHTAPQPQALMDGVKLWRLSKPGNIFHLQRYSEQDQGDRTIHRGHFVVTNKPEEFPQSTIKIL